MPRPIPARSRWRRLASAQRLTSQELFKMMAGVDLLHVPYRGSGFMLTDLVGGQVQMAFDNLPASIEHIRAGKVRARALMTFAKPQVLGPAMRSSEALLWMLRLSWTRTMVLACAKWMSAKSFKTRA